MNLDEGFGCLLSVVWIAVIIFIIPWERLYDELTVYPVDCVENKRVEKCNKGFVTSERIIFSMNEQRAEVVYVYPSSEEKGVRKLIDCAISNSRNWNCKFLGDFKKLTAIDGLLVRDALDASNGTAYVRRWQWWVIEAYNWVTDKPLFRNGRFFPDQYTSGR